MAKFLTYDDVERLRSRLKLSESTLIKNASFSYHDKDIFLSHSSQDKNELPLVIDILQNHGGTVYIDDGDDRLPEIPSKETAEILRDEIKATKKFVLFVSKHSKDSRWIPWELGLSDAFKNPANVALFPIAELENDQSWLDQEYLGLYWRIVWNMFEGKEKPCWIVYDHETNKGRTLSDWIQD